MHVNPSRRDCVFGQFRETRSLSVERGKKIYQAPSATPNDLTIYYKATCDLVREVASEFGGLAAGGICQTPTHLTTRDEDR